MVEGGDAPGGLGVLGDDALGPREVVGVGAVVGVEAQEQHAVVDEVVVAQAGTVGDGTGDGVGVRQEEVLAVGRRTVVVVADVGGEGDVVEGLGGEELRVLVLVARGVDLVAHGHHEVGAGVLGGREGEVRGPRLGVGRDAAARAHLRVAEQQGVEVAGAARGELLGRAPAIGLGADAVGVGGVGGQTGDGGLVERPAGVVRGAGGGRRHDDRRGGAVGGRDGDGLGGTRRRVPDDVALGRRGADVDDGGLEVGSRQRPGCETQDEGECDQGRREGP